MKLKSTFGLILIFVFGLGHAGFLFAADTDAVVRAEAKLLKDKIKIGDEIRLSVRVEHPRKYTVFPIDKNLKIEPFEIKSVDDKPIIRGQNRVETIYLATLTVFAVGKVELPEIAVSYTKESGESGVVKTEKINVEVAGANKKLTDKDDIRPIKGAAASNLQRFWNVVFIFIISILVAVLLTISVKRYLRSLADQESRKPAHIRVQLELNRLKDKGFLEEKNYTEFYGEFTNILRRYFNRRYGVDALDKTSTELMRDLAKYGIPFATMEKIASLVTEADLVKFAKVAPDYEVSKKLEMMLLEIAEETKPLEKKK